MNNNEQLDSIRVTQQWLERIVIGLNLCPFAKREYQKERIRFKQSLASDEQALLHDLVVELGLLNRRDDIETTVLIVPNALAEFSEYNQFLSFVDTLIREMDLDGVFQVASFHPQYQFAGTRPDDVENYTNRAPYPILHILREASLEKAIERHPNTAQIPQDNIKLMQLLGLTQMANLLRSCEPEPGADLS